MKLLIPPPIVALVAAALIWFLAPVLPDLAFDHPWNTPAAVVLACCSAALDFASVGLFLRKKTTVSPLDPDRSKVLVTNGMYRFTRNPMYLGMAGLLVAFGIWTGNAVFIPVVAGFVVYLTIFQIQPEEAALKMRFGEDYTAYCKRVRRWI